jgi:serine/threonine-protein kinase
VLETLGHYRLLERIGGGAMGELFRARDMRHGRTVAVRIVAEGILNEAARRERFLRDARAATALSHPNIATLFEIGDDQGHHFLVSEFVPGETLRNAIAGRPLNARRAIEYGTQLADAVAEGHAEGILHGDLKPENIIITPKGNAKVLDFGFAAWTGGGAARDRMAGVAGSAAPLYGEMLGRTVPYMAPEQARGESTDWQSDIFSLGVVLFEMLTGRVPFTAPTPAAVAAQLAQSDAPPPSALNPALPAELDPIVSRMLARELERRYQSAAPVAAELRAVAAILDVRTGSAAPPAVVRRQPVRRRPAAAVGWVAALAVVAITVLLVWLAIRM